MDDLAQAMGFSLLTYGDPALRMESIGLKAHPWQEQVLRSKSKRMLLLCARQTGKSQVVAAMAYNEVVNNPRSLVLIVSYKLEQSQEMFRKVKEFHQTDKLAMRPEQESALSIELPNRSRIVCLPNVEASVRSYSSLFSG